MGQEYPIASGLQNLQSNPENETAVSVRVIKIGGNLLRSPGGISRIVQWLRERTIPQCNRIGDVYLTGGGAAADEIRRRDAAEGLGDLLAHRLAIEAMSGQLQLLHREIPEFQPVASLNALLQTLGSGPPIFFDVADWILTRTGVPHSWDFTSDSIAARLALDLGAAELVLLKSWLPPRNPETPGQAGGDIATLYEAAELGLVDRHFPELAAGIPLVRLLVPGFTPGGNGGQVIAFVDGQRQAGG